MHLIQGEVVRIPRRLIEGAAITVVAVSTFLASKNVFGLRSMALLATMAFLGAVLIISRPKLVVLGLIVLSCTVFRLPIAPVAFAGVRTDLAELLVFALIGAWLVPFGVWQLRARQPYLGPLLVMAGTAVVGTVHGLSSGGDRQLAQGNLKVFLAYLVVLPLCALFASRDDKRFLADAVIWISTVGSAYVVAAVAIGLPLASDAPTGINTLGREVVAQRVRPALVGLLFLATLLVIGRGTAVGWSLWRGAQVGLFLVVLALSFNRSGWLPLIFVSVILVATTRGRDPLTPLRTGLATAVVAVGVVVVAASGVLGPTALALVERLSSTTTTAIVREPSYTDRAEESAQAVKAIARSPLLGQGLGTTYGVRRLVYRPDLDRNVYESRDFVHNSLLFAYLQLGLVGVLAFTMLGQRVWREVRAARSDSSVDDGSRSLAAGLAVGGTALVALFQDLLLHRSSVLVVAVALCLAVSPDDSGATNSE